MNITNQILAYLELYHSVEYHCEKSEIRYFAYVVDNANHFHYYHFYNNKRDTVDFVMNEVLKANKTLDDFKLKDGDFLVSKNDDLNDDSFLEEKDGKLYYHWVHYEHTCPLFNFPGAPKTKEELRKYIENNNSLYLNIPRASIFTCISNILVANSYVNSTNDTSIKDMFENVSIKSSMKEYNKCYGVNVEINNEKYMYNSDVDDETNLFKVIKVKF